MRYGQGLFFCPVWVQTQIRSKLCGQQYLARSSCELPDLLWRLVVSCRNAAKNEKGIHMLILRTVDHRSDPKEHCDGSHEI